MKYKSFLSVCVALTMLCGCSGGNQTSSNQANNDSTVSESFHTSWKGAFVYVSEYVIQLDFYDNGIITETSEGSINHFLTNYAPATPSYTQEGNIITFKNCDETTAEIREFEGEEILVILEDNDERPEYPMFKSDETAQKYLEYIVEKRYEDIQGVWNYKNDLGISDIEKTIATITETEIIMSSDIPGSVMFGTSEYEIVANPDSFYGTSFVSDFSEIEELVYCTNDELLFRCEFSFYLMRAE